MHYWCFDFGTMVPRVKDHTMYDSRSKEDRRPDWKEDTRLEWRSQYGVVDTGSVVVWSREDTRSEEDVVQYLLLRYCCCDAGTMLPRLLEETMDDSLSQDGCVD